MTISRISPLDRFAHNSSLWGDEEFADATIIMGQKTWRAHRAVICKQSKYFQNALEGQFAVSVVFMMLK